MDKQYPVDGNATEQLDFIADQIKVSSLVALQSERLQGPVWALCEDGSIRFINAAIGPARTLSGSSS